MEFIGRTLKKDFQGFGVFTGTIQSYDESSKYFEIVYEDGDSEELDFSEVVSLLENDKVKVSEEGLVHVKPSRGGRKPKKRRRMERKRGESGKSDETLGKVDLNDGFVDLNLNNGDLNLNDEVMGKFKEECGFENGNMIVDVEIKDGLGFDLNAGFNFKLNGGEGFNLNLNDEGLEENMGSVKKEREYIDLNLDVNGDMEESLEVVETRKKECGFDLNLGVDDEVEDDSDGDCVGKVKESVLLESVEELKEVRVTQDFSYGLVGGIRRETSMSVDDFRAQDGCNGVQLKDESVIPAATEIDGCQGDMGSSRMQGTGRRKRRRVIDNLNSSTEPVLRRSTRRGSAKNNVLRSSTTCDFSDLSSTAAGVSMMEELPVTLAAETFDEPAVLPPKLQLPPSSQNLDLDGILVLDVFSIYSCLRSFSTLLFLSPFELDDFVAALKCSSPSLLFDCIHVSILRMLRKHLEHLSNEGFESASSCLRSLNWNLLDLITWPVFMVEYFLIHDSVVKPSFDLTRLKLFKSDYYRQPVSVKVEMLRCLCDDMIEMEAIRMELSRRSSGAEPDLEFDRNINNEFGKKRRVAMDMSGGSCLTEEVIEDANDWNSDECCLCKMDGNLLCCDGCPAAYHSKCVGVASDLLPEGDWFCPECALDRRKPWMKPRRSLRGAELLGVDPQGRLYFSSCGYLLVSDSCEAECTFNFYHRNDLNVVIDVLKSSEIFYGDIVNAIFKQLDITVGFNGVQSNLDSLNNVNSSMHTKAEAPDISMPNSMPLASSETCAIMSKIVRKPEENCDAGYSGHLDSDAFKSVNVLDSLTAAERPNVSSEGSAETTPLSSVIQNFQKQEPNYSHRAAKFSNQSEMLGKSPPLGDSSMTSTGSNGRQKIASPGNILSVINTRKADRQVQCEIAYMNHYSFAQTASSVVEELMPKSSNEIKEEVIKSEEEVISTQMKTILKKSDKFCWPNIQNLNVDTEKERCGWCFSCKVPTDDIDCLFNMNNGNVLGSLKSEVVGLQSKRNKKGHLVDIICHILSIEDRLCGLLVGPWLNPHYTKLWRKSALKAADLASVKHLLLTLESNLHHLALSAEWLKHVDSLATLGSASHIVIASSRASKQGIGRKKARLLDPEGNPSSNGAGGLSLCWWRGGRVSCQLFSWKVLPRSLVSKAARQAGCAKIPGILYSESSDFSKRIRNVAWRAAVESSTTVEQLAVQVREFDLNIRWDDIENTHPLSIMDKEFKKSSRLFKKAIIRRKCLKEGEGIKYLIDFGKRRNVPDIVVKHGSMVEESSSGRKRYWLKESYVPLHLLKSFEERRIARKSAKLKPGKLLEANRATKKSLRKRGFSYLFSKAEKSEYYQCGHCNKDVLIREAVCCQFCKGFFHKRHIRKSAGTVTAECAYTCYRCQDGRFMKPGKKAAKTGTKKGKANTRSVKVQSQKSKKATTDCKSVQLKSRKKPVGRRPLRSKNDKQIASVPLRRSTRKIKFVSVPIKKRVGRKKGKQKTKKKISRKPKKDPSWRKQRTQVYYSYWLNGLLLSRKPDDERVMLFRKKFFFDSSEYLTDVLDKPKCYLCCDAGYTSTSNFIACEICGEWSHGDAYGVNVENINKLIGFRCHVCRNRTPPACPCKEPVGSDGLQLVEEQINNKMECSEDVCEPVLPETEVKYDNQSHSIEELQGSVPVDQCFHKEEELCSSVLESRSEGEKDHAFDSMELNVNSIDVSNKDLKAGVLTSNENVVLEENTVRVVHDDTVIHDQAEPRSCKVDLDLMDTESALLRHDEEKDGSVKTPPILNSPVDGTLLDSKELHSQTCLTSEELIDGEKTM